MDRAVEHAELAGDAARLLGGGAGRALGRGAHEHEGRAVEPRGRADGGGRVEPAPDPAVPEHDGRAGGQAGSARGATRAGRAGLGLDAERDDVDAAAQRRVGVVDRRRDQALAEQCAQPQVALDLRGAHQVVGAAQRERDAVDHERADAAAQRVGAPAQRLERLERLGVVEVDDHPRRGLREQSGQGAATVAGR